MDKIIDGKLIAKKVRNEIKEEVNELKKQGKRVPGLAVVIVGENPASKIYVGHKEKGTIEVGMKSVIHRMDENISQEELMQVVDDLNNDASIHGILVQLPLPKHLDEKEVILKINPEKDVDGFHPVNAGALMVGEDALVSCTPKGCIKLLKESGVEISGKKAVVVGRSNIVGKPVAMLLLQENATVTICHSRTKDLKAELEDADIIIAAVGVPKLVTAEMVKEGAVVIDVGMNRLESGKLCGDVDFEGILPKASLITPVPGGVGPMTIAMLLENTLQAYRKIEA